MRRWQPRTLAGTFLVLQLAVVALVLLVAAVVSVRQAQAQFRSYAAERILGAAESLASNPLVRERGLVPTTASDLAPVAESVRVQSGASTVLLARILLHERLNLWQVTGVGCALAAVALIVSSDR